MGRYALWRLLYHRFCKQGSNFAIVWKNVVTETELNEDKET